MKKELDDRLVQTFPNLYRMRYGSMRETCMCWGFDCGDGWFQIIWNLSEKLEKLILTLPEEEREYYFAQQVKEKYGGLRFYMSSQTEEMDSAIDEADQLSTQTCEICGQPGELFTTGWWKTDCGKH